VAPSGEGPGHHVDPHRARAALLEDAGRLDQPPLLGMIDGGHRAAKVAACAHLDLDHHLGIAVTDHRVHLHPCEPQVARQHPAAGQLQVGNRQGLSGSAPHLRDSHLHSKHGARWRGHSHRDRHPSAPQALAAPSPAGRGTGVYRRAGRPSGLSPRASASATQVRACGWSTS
jgi:hypothetical protein